MKTGPFDWPTQTRAERRRRRRAQRRALRELKRLMKKTDMRLGQIMINSYDRCPPGPDRWNCTDEEWARRLLEFRHWIEERL